VTRIVPVVAVRALSICWGKPARRRGRIAIGFSEALPMTDFNFVLLYVENPAVSADFYAGLLGKPPVEAAPTFVMFALESGMMLGLWSRLTVQPPPTAAGGGEIAIALADRAAVEALHDSWRGRGVAILQPPTDMVFGHTFVATDPDGHRLRVFAAPAA
jgi:predicted enzyme related to lactoylglutathione lyase